MPSLQKCVWVNCWWPRAVPEAGLAQSGSGLAAELSLPQHCSSWAGTAVPWGRHCSEHTLAQAGCWPAGLSTACVQPQGELQLNIKSLSLLFKTPHIGPNTQLATTQHWLTGCICWNENVAVQKTYQPNSGKSPIKTLLKPERHCDEHIVTAGLITDWLKSSWGSCVETFSISTWSYKSFSKLLQLFRAVLKDQVFLV